MKKVFCVVVGVIGMKQKIGVSDQPVKNICTDANCEHCQSLNDIKFMMKVFSMYDKTEADRALSVTWRKRAIKDLKRNFSCINGTIPKHIL